jgi:flavin reductase (DIM6/NTAB) family NADH-FMN oxidoreductase RutF/effector-binding domain-containing protein
MDKAKTGPFIPMPIAPTVLVGANVSGKPNYLAVGFVSGANMRPPILCVSLNHRHHTVKGILENGTFSVNIPSAAHARECDYCGLVSGRSADKSNVFTTFYGELGTAPMIQEFPIVCECRYTGQKIDFSMDSVFFGEVVQCYVDKALYKKGEPADILRIDPLLTGLDRRYRRVGEEIGKAFSIGWEYCAPSKSDSGSREGGKIVNCGPRTALLKELVPREIADPAFIAKAFKEILEQGSAQGLNPTDGPFIRKHEWMEPDTALHAGYVFPLSAKGGGRIEAERLPGGRYAELLHKGPYSGTNASIESLVGFARERGFEGKGPVYEFYRNDPASTPPEKLETLLTMPIKKA